MDGHVALVLTLRVLINSFNLGEFQCILAILLSISKKRSTTPELADWKRLLVKHLAFSVLASTRKLDILWLLILIPRWFGQVDLSKHFETADSTL
jgi:hypothetical protein